MIDDDDNICAVIGRTNAYLGVHELCAFKELILD
jgi:hypothetical protein